MKKIVTLLLTAALAVAAATTAFADTEIKPGPVSSPTPASGDMDVTYTVKPSYTVTIPTSVTLDSNSKSNTATIKVKKVTVDYGKKAKVALKSDTNFTVKAGKNTDDPTLAYKVWKGNTEVMKGDTVLEVTPNATGKKGETTLKFEIASDIVYSGTYTGQVTFNVSVGN